VWEKVHIGPEEADGRIWVAIRQQRVAAANPTSKQLAVIGSYEIRVWSIEGIDETWRFLHGDQVYNITSIDRPNLNSRELVIIAKRDKLKPKEA
jgi:head-tail adaptor